MQQKLNNLLIIVLSFTVIVLVSVIFFLIFVPQNEPVQKTTNNNTNTDINTNTEEIVEENTSSTMKTFSNERLSFTYPEGYEIEEIEGAKNNTIKVSSELGYMDIFKMQTPQGGKVTAFGIGPDGPDPKKMKVIENGDDWADVWMFYEDGDTKTEEDFMKIFSSIRLKTQELQVQEQTKTTTQTKLTAQSCPTNWTWYQYDYLHLGFCYMDTWGKPEVRDETHVLGEGQLINIRFANDVYIGGHSTPNIWVESKDFSPSDGDFSVLCFECIDFSDDTTTILNKLDWPDMVTRITKTKVDGKNALRLYKDYTMYEDHIREGEYIIPNMNDDYHIQISIKTEQASALDEFVRYLKF